MTYRSDRLAGSPRRADYFNVGDPVLYGKWQNKPGIIKEIKRNEKGFPAVVIEPVPKGRKDDKEIALFRIRKDKKRERNHIHFVLLDGIGNAVVEDIELEEIESIIAEMA